MLEATALSAVTNNDTSKANIRKTIPAILRIDSPSCVQLHEASFVFQTRSEYSIPINIKLGDEMSQMLLEAKEAADRVHQLIEADQDLYKKLGERLRSLNPSTVTTVARGSSDHAASYASYLIPLCTGKPVASLPPSVVTVLNSQLQMSQHFMLAISQSGASPDILRTLERGKQGGALTAALVNDISSPLAKCAEFLLDQRAGLERGLAATKTVLCTNTAIARIVAEWTLDQKLQRALSKLSENLTTAYQAGLEFDPELLNGITNVYVVSRSLGYGAAHEIALKLKETCGIHAEAYSSAEVRHGPREIVNRNFAVIALALPGAGGDDVLSIAEELKAQGAKLITIGAKEKRPTFILPEGEDFRLAPLLALQMLYPWLAKSSVALGRDPDHPKQLKSKVIHTV